MSPSTISTNHFDGYKVTQRRLFKCEMYCTFPSFFLLGFLCALCLKWPLLCLSNLFITSLSFVPPILIHSTIDLTFSCCSFGPFVHTISNWFGFHFKKPFNLATVFYFRFHIRIEQKCVAGL